MKEEWEGSSIEYYSLLDNIIDDLTNALDDYGDDPKGFYDFAIAIIQVKDTMRRYFFRQAEGEK